MIHLRMYSASVANISTATPQANFYKRSLRLCQEALNKLPKFEHQQIFRAVLVSAESVVTGRLVHRRFTHIVHLCTVDLHIVYPYTVD